jgi:hypothetical protein
LKTGFLKVKRTIVNPYLGLGGTIIIHNIEYRSKCGTDLGIIHMDVYLDCNKTNMKMIGSIKVLYNRSLTSKD